MNDSLPQILRRADTPDRPAPPAFANRVRSISLRRRQYKGALLGTLLFLPAIFLLPNPQSPIPNPQSLRAQADDFRREAETRLAAVDRMIALERPPVRRPLPPDALLEIRGERERAAQILLYHADRYLNDFHQPDTASAEYRRILELFPNTHWASIARERLEQLTS